jgi:hypothetical protein
VRFFPGQDRRHDVDLVGSWRFKRYTVGARFGFSTGTPFTEILGEFDRHEYSAIEHGWVSTTGLFSSQFVMGPRNGDRLPISHRLDLSVTRGAKPGGFSVSPYLSIVNVYNKQNVVGYVFDYTGRPPQKHRLPGFPIFPSLGLSIVW